MRRHIADAYLGAMLSATLIVGANFALPAQSAEPLSYGPFDVRSDGGGQLSSTLLYTTRVHTDGKLLVSYLAPPQHCSSIRMHFLVDDQEKAISAVLPPGRATGYIDLGPVSPGEHRVSLQAEGVTGGCNVGYTKGARNASAA